jgi:hypothetical protein
MSGPHGGKAERLGKLRRVRIRQLVIRQSVAGGNQPEHRQETSGSIRVP